MYWQAELNSQESFTLIPLRSGTKEGTDSFWLFTNTGALHFLSSFRFLRRVSFPVLFAHPGREAVHAAAAGDANFPSSSVSSASLGKSVEGGSCFSNAQAKGSRLPPLCHSVSTPRHKHVWEGTKERKEGSLGLPGSLKMPGSQLG